VRERVCAVGSGRGCTPRAMRSTNRAALPRLRCLETHQELISSKKSKQSLRLRVLMHVVMFMQNPLFDCL
jgi:hypothetical protein